MLIALIVLSLLVVILSILVYFMASIIADPEIETFDEREGE